MPLIEDIKPKKGKIKSLPETKTSAENFSVDEKNIKNSFDDEGAEKDFFQAEDGIRDLTVTGVQTCVFRSTIFLSTSI